MKLNRLLLLLALMTFHGTRLLADLQPATALVTQTVIAQGASRDVGEETMWVWTGGRLRGYEVVTFNLDPVDQTRGSQWVTWDSGQQRPAVVMDDLNAACGQTTVEGVAGQRIMAARQVGNLLGTGPARGSDGLRRPGGHVLRDGRDLGGLDEGWSVTAFEEHWSGPLWLADAQERACMLALATSADGARTRLLGVLRERLVPLGIEGGPELAGFVVVDQRLYYRDAQGRLWSRELTRDTPPALVEQPDPAIMRLTDSAVAHLYRGDRDTHGGNALDPEIQFALTPAGDLLPARWSRGRKALSLGPEMSGVCPGVARHQIDLWPRIWHLIAKLRPELLGGSSVLHDRLRELHLDQGYVCFAREGGEGEPASLHLYQPGTDGPTRIGTLAPCHNQLLSRVYQLRVASSGRIYVLAGNEQMTVLQVYESPLLPNITALANEAMALIHDRDAQPAVTCRVVTSLYRFGGQCDRGYDCVTAASDGQVYFATMPHHPLKGSPLLGYDPRSDQTRVLGDLDTLARNTGPGQIPNMVHTAPVEMNGRLYWVGQDPFYGQHVFPGMTEQTHRHQGSPLLACDLATGRFAMLGIPLPGDLSVFGLVADPARDVLFLRRGYWPKDQKWYQLPIEPGGVAGPLTALPWDRQPETIHVSERSRLYFVVPRETPKDAPPDAPAPADVMRFDPVSGEAVRMGELDIRALHPEALPLSPRQTLNNEWEWILGQSADAVKMYAWHRGTTMLAEVDLYSGASRLVCHMMADRASFPVQEWGPVILSGNRVCWFSTDLTGPFRGTRPYVADLATGEVRRLGMLRDQRGRWVEDVTMVTVDRLGRVYLGGMALGLPDDPHFNERSLYNLPIKWDTIFAVMDRLPE
jgi:hypothetical protein